MDCLWSPPEQAGWLKKQCHASKNPKWGDRFFVLKGSFLFYFINRKSIHKLHGVIPLENAKVETEAPPVRPAKKEQEDEPAHIITITLHATHAYSCKHAFYVLLAPTAEVQSAWVNALWQAAIPRGELVMQLSSAGRLANLVAAYAQQLQQCFPTADASVLSTSGRARISGAVGNIGTLAGVLRRNKREATNRRSQDVTQLPTLPGSTAPPTTVLARTASGSIIPAAAAQWGQGARAEGEAASKATLPDAATVDAKSGREETKAVKSAVTVTATSTRKSYVTGGNEPGLREKAALQAAQAAALTAAIKAGAADTDQD